MTSACAMLRSCGHHYLSQSRFEANPVESLFYREMVICEATCAHQWPSSSGDLNTHSLPQKGDSTWSIGVMISEQFQFRENADFLRKRHVISRPVMSQYWPLRVRKSQVAFIGKVTIWYDHESLKYGEFRI